VKKYFAHFPRQLSHFPRQLSQFPRELSHFPRELPISQYRINKQTKKTPNILDV